MKKILFVETLLDYRTALEHLRRNPEDAAGLLVVNLNAGIEMNFSGIAAVIRTENDYLRKDTLAGINAMALELGRTWFLDPQLAPLLEIEGLSLGLVLENFLVRELIAVAKYLRLANVILAAETRDEILLIDHPEGLPQIHNLLPSNDEKIFNRVLEILGQKQALPLRRIPSLEPSAPPAESGKDWVESMLSLLANAVRKFANRLLPKRRGKAIAFVGAPRLMFPLLDEFRGTGERIVYFQNVFGPRMVPRLWGKRALYRITDDYQSAGEDAECGVLRRELGERLERLTALPRFRALFTFEGTDLTAALLPRLRFVFEECLPGIVINVRRFHRFFKEEGIGAIAIDEAVKEFSRPFILAANAAGIPSVEIQHGIPKYYMHHRLVTTKLAAWGEYCKTHFVAEGRLNPEDVVVTGSPTLDVLVRRDGRGDPALVRRGLGIEAGDRIITFAASPFHLGSRGGVIDEHLTREQVEGALKEMLKAVASFDNVHFVVKLHHTDPNLERVRAFIQDAGFKKPFTVVKAFDIYALMNASEAVLSLGSTSILEAIALGTPVIAMDVSDGLDVKPFAERGALVPVTGAEDMSNALELILGDKKIFLRAAQEGRTKALRDFAASADGQSGKRCVALLKDLLSR